MNNLENIFYDFVGNVVFDAYGKIYPIKGDKRWYYINVGKDKVSVSKLKRKFLIRDFDDFSARYAIYFYANAPCPAMGYYVFRKITGKQISLQEYFKARK